MSVALSIAFTGLCALIADGDGKPGEVLLLDAKGVGEVQGITLPEHAPTLAMSLSDLANAETSGPTRVIVAAPGVDQIGLWDLTGSEVRIRAQGGEGTGLQLFKPLPGDTSWPHAPRAPHDPSSWRDLRFVADMRTLAGDGRIDPALISGEASMPGVLPGAVAARIRLDAGLLEGAIPSQEIYRDDEFEFRADGGTPGPRQALTDTVRWTLQTEAAAVVIEIVPVAGGPIKRLLLAPHATSHQVFISNLPTENSSHADAHPAMSDEEMGALHFGAYYKLLLNEPAHRLLPIPWRAGTTHPHKGAGNIRSGFCPGALFSRN